MFHFIPRFIHCTSATARRNIYLQYYYLIVCCLCFFVWVFSTFLYKYRRCEYLKKFWVTMISIWTRGVDTKLINQRAVCTSEIIITFWKNLVRKSELLFNTHFSASVETMTGLSTTLGTYDKMCPALVVATFYFYHEYNIFS